MGIIFDNKTPHDVLFFCGSKEVPQVLLYRHSESKSAKVIKSRLLTCAYVISLLLTPLISGRLTAGVFLLMVPVCSSLHADIDSELQSKLKLYSINLEIQSPPGQAVATDLLQSDYKRLQEATVQNVVVDSRLTLPGGFKFGQTIT